MYVLFKGTREVCPIKYPYFQLWFLFKIYLPLCIQHVTIQIKGYARLKDPLKSPSQIKKDGFI